MSNDNKSSSKKRHQLDARRLLCPMPVIRVQQLIEALGEPAIGDEIEASCTDPGALYDIPAWARVHGHEVIATSDEDDEYHIIIKICSDND
jgi:tRNA 2-thiouridine synthesizing protein A